MLKTISDYKAKSFIAEKNFSSIAYEVKRTRAVWDDSLSIPGTERRGGWRCPPGTRYGGQITDRFGRNCGWGVARRLVNELGDLGQRLENIDDRRRGRRERRGLGRPEARPGLVERAAGRIARAFDTEDDSTPTPPRGRRERQGPVRRRPNLRDSEQRRMDREIDQPGAPRTDEVIPERRGREGRRRRNLRTSEQRRMDREIDQPGAERTAPGEDAPSRPRPAAPRARRREATADVRRDKPDARKPNKPNNDFENAREVERLINANEFKEYDDRKLNELLGWAQYHNDSGQFVTEESLAKLNREIARRRAAKRPAKKKAVKKKAPARKAPARRIDAPEADKPAAEPKLVPAKPAEAAPRRVNIGDFAEDSRIIGGDFDGAAERIDGIDANNELVGDAEDMERELRAIIDRMDRLPDNAIVAVPDGFGGNKDMKVADLRRNMAAAADAWGRFAKRRNKVRNRRNQPQRVNMRDVADNSQQIVGDFEGAAQRIDDMKTGWGVENPNQVADDLDAIARRLDRYPEDAVIEVPDADADNGVKDVKVGDLRENMKKAAAAWRRYAKRQRGGRDRNNADIGQLQLVNLDADDSVNAVANILRGAFGEQDFLDAQFIRNALAENAQQNEDYIQRIKKIAANNPALAKQLLEENIRGLQQNMEARKDSIRATLRLVARDGDQEARVGIARGAMTDIIYLKAQQTQMENVQNLLAEIRNANPAKPQQAAANPAGRAVNGEYFDRDELLGFVGVDGVEMPVLINQEINRLDAQLNRDVERVERAAGMALDDIDNYLDRAARRQNRLKEQRKEAIAEVTRLRNILAQNKDDQSAQRRYWRAVNNLVGADYQVKSNARLMAAYEKRREEAAAELNLLGNESASVILQNENAVKEARSRVAAALNKQQKVLAAYLDKRYGKDNKPWLEMTPDKIKDLKDRAARGDEEAKRELLTWAKSMYEHPLIEGTNGKNYQIVMDRQADVHRNGDIYLKGTVYHIDENGRRTKVGSTEREIHISAVDQKDWYVKNAYLKIEAERHKKAGIATTYNQHAYMWANAAGIPKAKVGTAWDGPYVWARAGFRSPVESTSVTKMEGQLLAFRNGDLTGLIKTEAEAVRIAALIREYKLYQKIPRDQRPAQPPVGHIDFIYALDIPEGRGKVTRQAEMKEWFVQNMPLGSGDFDFAQNGITRDPRD